MDTIVDVVKGSRVRVSFQRAHLPCLTGAMMKVGLKVWNFTGTCHHFYSSSADGSTGVTIYVTPDNWDDVADLHRVTNCSCGQPHIAINQWDIVGLAS